jgi:hypothetical protein
MSLAIRSTLNSVDAGHAYVTTVRSYDDSTVSTSCKQPLHAIVTGRMLSRHDTFAFATHASQAIYGVSW